MIILDYQDRRPIYEQITEKFRTLIYQGALPAGSRLPSVRQLAMELSINPNTCSTTTPLPLMKQNNLRL